MGMKNFIAVCIVAAVCCTQLEGMENNSISYEFAGCITAFAVARDGCSLVVGLDTGQVTLLKIETGEQISYCGHRAPVSALAMGSYIAIGYETGELYVLDGQMQELHDLAKHEKAIKKIVIDGTCMATLDNEYAKIWDLFTGRCTAILAFKQPVQSVALSNQYQKLFAAVGCSIFGYDFSKSEGFKPLERHSGTIVSLSIADGLMFSASDNGSVCVWNLSLHECIKKYYIEKNIEAIKVDSDRRILVVVYKDSAVAWDYKTGMMLDKITMSQHMPGMIAIGCDKIISCSDKSIVTIHKIADYTFSLIIRNELNEPIENFELLGCEQRSLTAFFSFQPHEHKRVSISSVDSFRDWYIRFMCNGETVITKIDKPLVPLKEIVLTYNIINGAILASIEPGGAKKRFLQLFYQKNFPIPSDKDDLELPILAVGKPIKKITLTDSKGGIVNAKRNFFMQAQWNIMKAHHYAPYELCVQAKDGTRYQWHIPFLFNGIEAMLSLPEEYHATMKKKTFRAFSDDSCSGIQSVRTRSLSAPCMRVVEEKVLNISRKPVFSLYKEVSAQEYRVPGCLQCQAEVADLHMIREQVH
jgi:WD40 repeat protein